VFETKKRGEGTGLLRSHRRKKASAEGGRRIAIKKRGKRAGEKSIRRGRALRETRDTKKPVESRMKGLNPTPQE